MKLVSKTFSTLVKKPLILLYWGIILFVLFWAGSNIGDLISSFIYGSGSMFASDGGQENPYYTIMSLIMMVVSNITSKALGVKVLIGVLIAILAYTLLSAAFFAGYNNTVYNSFNREKKETDGFFSGIRRFFVRYLYMTVISVFLFFGIVLLAVIGVMPALTAFLYHSEGQASLMLAILLSVLTAIATIFVFLYYLVYFTMWFPALCSGKERPFRLAAFVINRNYWAIMVRYFLALVTMLIVNVLFSKIMSLFSGIVPVMTLKWISLIVIVLINTVMVSFFSVYGFTLYRFFFSKTKAEMLSAEK